MPTLAPGKNNCEANCSLLLPTAPLAVTHSSPPRVPSPADDPLLPVVLAAKKGDERAERELLLRLAPVALEVIRQGLGRVREERALALDALVTTLRALPGFTGDERVSLLVARITLEGIRRRGVPLAMHDDTLLSRGQARAESPQRGGESAQLRSLVDEALRSDAAVMVSHVALRGHPGRAGLGRRYIALAVVALLAAGLFGFWAARAARRATSDDAQPTSHGMGATWNSDSWKASVASVSAAPIAMGSQSSRATSRFLR